jgi:hypothetical protein
MASDTSLLIDSQSVELYGSTSSSSSSSSLVSTLEKIAESQQKLMNQNQKQLAQQQLKQVALQQQLTESQSRRESRHQSPSSPSSVSSNPTKPPSPPEQPAENKKPDPKRSHNSERDSFVQYVCFLVFFCALFLWLNLLCAFSFFVFLSLFPSESLEMVIRMTMMKMIWTSRLANEGKDIQMKIGMKWVLKVLIADFFSSVFV